MKKIVLGVLAATAVAAPLALSAAPANAAVARCQETVRHQHHDTAAKFTVNQPKDTVGQFTNVWKHVYAITVDSSGTFSGTGSVTANGAATSSGPRRSPASSLTATATAPATTSPSTPLPTRA